jgi:hypothetical protein
MREILVATKKKRGVRKLLEQEKAIDARARKKHRCP